MFGVVRLGHFGLNPKVFAHLTIPERNDLLACRDALMAVLKGIQSGTNVGLYLTPDLVRRYSSTETLAASLIAPETSSLAAGVSDFSWAGGVSEIQLKFFAFTFSEGELAVSEKFAHCQ